MSDRTTADLHRPASTGWTDLVRQWEDWEVSSPRNNGLADNFDNFAARGAA